MSIGISPTVDFAFKMMLGNPQHTGVTIHFLNAVLGEKPKITAVEILNPFLGKGSENEKLSVLDILATDEHGRKLNIEMQTTLPLGLHQRLAYYVSKLYVDQMIEGTRYADLHPAISICVLTKSLFPLVSGLHLDFRLREPTGILLTDDLQIHLLELPKLRVTSENVYHATAIERWAYFLRNAETLTPDEVGRIFPDREIVEAAGVLEMISQTPEERRLYDARLKFQRDQIAIQDGIREEVRKEALLEGLREGRSEGRSEGRNEGRSEGIREGRGEGRREGELIGRVLMLQEILGISQSTKDELSTRDEVQLNELVEQLKLELRARGK